METNMRKKFVLNFFLSLLLFHEPNTTYMDAPKYKKKPFNWFVNL